MAENQEIVVVVVSPAVAMAHVNVVKDVIVLRIVRTSLNVAERFLNVILLKNPCVRK